jgi:small subunit ribosomal protein S11
MTNEINNPEVLETVKDGLVAVEEVPDKAAADSLDDLPEEVRKKLEKGATVKTVKKIRGRKKRKGEKKVAVGKAFISSTYNNTIVTLTDLDGNVLAWSSAGVAGFKGPKKSTPYAATIITKIAVLKAKEYGLNEVSVFVKGVGTGRESAIRALNANGLNVTFIKDITPIPHNGCRRKKPRRV